MLSNYRYLWGFVGILAIIIIVSLSLRQNTKNIPSQISQPTQYIQRSPQTLLLDSEILQKKKQQKRSNKILRQQYTRLLKEADSLLKKSPVSVMNKKQIPPSHDRHDYYSLAPYYWPNPLSNKLPYISHDGETNPERNTIPDAQSMQQMISSSRTLAVAYYFSDNKSYATKSAALLRSWFIDPTTKMNPNLAYAQTIKGSHKVTAGVIDAANLPLVIDTIALLDNSGTLTDHDKLILHQWFADYLKWLITSKQGLYAKSLQNNIGSWYDFQVLTIALFIDDKQTVQDTLTRIQDKRIPTQINPNGEQPLETKRTKSWDYSLYNLEALTNLAMVSTHTENNLWYYQTSDGRSIKKALDFLLPYVLHEEKWPYQQIKKATSKNLITPLKEAAYIYQNRDYLEKSEEIKKIYKMNDYLDLLF